MVSDINHGDMLARIAARFSRPSRDGRPGSQIDYQLSLMQLLSRAANGRFAPRA